MECRRGLAMRILSVCLSVKRVHCNKTGERSVQIVIPYMGARRIFPGGGSKSKVPQRESRDGSPAVWLGAKVVKIMHKCFIYWAFYCNY